MHSSNKKPWKQKGTGRARSGQRSSPVWVGGGKIFGPRPRDYSYAIPRKLKRLAMMSILSLKAKEDRLRVVQDFTVDTGKTKDLVIAIKDLTTQERTVVVLKDNDAMLRRAGRNVPWLSFLSFNRLAAHDLFYCHKLLVLETAAKNLNEFYGAQAKDGGRAEPEGGEKKPARAAKPAKTARPQKPAKTAKGAKA